MDTLWASLIALFLIALAILAAEALRTRAGAQGATTPVTLNRLP